MNIGYIIGLVLAIIVFVLGMAGGFPPYNFGQLGNFVDGASVMIVIGCSIGIVMASFPLKTFLGMPKHFAIMLKNPKISLTLWWIWRRLPEKMDFWPWKRRPMSRRTPSSSRPSC